MQKALSEIKDLDYAEAISRLSLQMTGLQAAQQSFAKVQGLSLFNYL
jgi:flagellar hook-associated protein 3 FlgL